MSYEEKVEQSIAWQTRHQEAQANLREARERVLSSGYGINDLLVCHNFAFVACSMATL